MLLLGFGDLGIVGYAHAHFRTRHGKNLSGRGDRRRILRSTARSVEIAELRYYC
jgi:hypothetical protein